MTVLVEDVFGGIFRHGRNMQFVYKIASKRYEKTSLINIRKNNQAMLLFITNINNINNKLPKLLLGTVRFLVVIVW